MSADPGKPTRANPNRWSPADDYLADPAVAPMRALLAALVRRVNRSRRAAAPPAQPPTPPDARTRSRA